MKDLVTTTDVQNQIVEAFEFRHAAKVFDPERKISESEFGTILDAARLSPSSFGMEPWQLLIVQDPDKRELLRPFTWGASGEMNGTEGQLRTASHFGIFLAHTDVTMSHESEYPWKHAIEVKKFPEEAIAGFKGAYSKFRTDDFKIETERQTTDWGARQAYIALGNVMTAAAMMGIDSCPIEGFDVAQASAVLEESFGIDPALYKPAVMVAFGYRAGPPMFPKTRRDMDQIVSWY